jgi:hypothetical protein
MNRRSALRTTVAIGLWLVTGFAVAQERTLKDQLTGTWTIVSADQTAPDGSKHQLFGAKPMGVLVLDPSGKYSQIIVRADRPKFKANSRLKGTAEENQSAVQGTVANFGTWSVDERDKTLIIRFESGMYPNQEGEGSRRIANLAGDELRLSNPHTGAAMKSELVWRRAKSP